MEMNNTALKDTFRSMGYLKHWYLRIFLSLNPTTMTLTVLISIIVLFGIWSVSKEYFLVAAQHRFEIKVLENTDRIQKRLSQYETVLHSGAAFYQASKYVSRDEWKHFIGSLELYRNYPGIQGIGLVKVVASKETEDLTRRMRDEGFPSFSIKSDKHGEIYATVLYLEPMDKRNYEAIGYDVLSESNRRKAVEQARDTGRAVITTKIQLLQEIDKDKQPGILMMLPLYKADAAITTTQQRREAFIGLVDSAFRMNDLMRHIVSKDATLNFEIHDSNKITDEHLLYRSFNPSFFHPKFHIRKTVTLYGQTWYLDFWSTPEFENEYDDGYPLLFTAIGLILYLGLLFLILYLVQAKKRANEKELFFKKSQRAAGIGSYSLDLQTMQWKSSETLDDLFGIDASYDRSVQGWIDLIHPQDREETRRYFTEEVVGQRQAFDHEYRIVRPNDQETRWLHGLGKLLFDNHGELVKMVGTIQDITERKQADVILHQLHQAVEQNPNSIVITDVNATIEYVNKKFTEITGYDKQEVIGKNPRFLKSNQTPPLTYRSMWEHLTSGEVWQGELMNRRKDGSLYVESATISPVRQPNGIITHYVATNEDIITKKQDEEHIHRLAHFDQLTGLPNRLMLNDRFAYVLNQAQRLKQNFAVMFLDLDYFKNVNDTLGHSIGDKLLIEIAHRLKQSIRDEDTVARLGGDEFILIFPRTDTPTAVGIANKLIMQISMPVFIAGHDLSITPSIGIALYPDDGKEFETLLKNADTAMYRVKNESRNGYSFFTEEMQKNLSRNLMLVNALRHAIENHQLEVYYQPQIALEDGRIVGAEALLRWIHPELGMISPSEFIPLAESSGQITAIGEWVLKTAIQQTKEWMDSGFSKMVIAVNLSAVQFRQVNLPDIVIDILDEIELPHECLELELTEAVTMYDPVAAISVMDTLHGAGIRMSIDDFGTGYSSLSYLKQFKIYKLKIDQSFIRDIATDPDDRSIVSAIIDMANSLGLRTIAEGIETTEQLAFLRLRGCNEIQGYYFSKPLPADQFQTLLEQHPWRLDNRL